MRRMGLFVGGVVLAAAAWLAMPLRAAGACGGEHPDSLAQARDGVSSASFGAVRAAMRPVRRPAARDAGVGEAYIDADHLYDTIASPFYDDSDRTPQGRLRWTAARYRRKVAAIAALVDSMALPLTALWGVENEAVVRDIAAACQGDYSYLHCTLNALDGMDFALLYHGDRFFPSTVEPGRRYLYVEGELRFDDGRRTLLGLLLCSDARTSGRWMTLLREEHPGVRLVAAGRLDVSVAEALGLDDVHARAARAGRGGVRRRNGWLMRDRMLVDTAFRATGGDVFARRFLLDPATGAPRPTYDRQRYAGGATYALPVYVYLH